MHPIWDHDIFYGFTEEDIPRVAALMATDSQPDPRYHTDAFGVVTDPNFMPWLHDRKNFCETRNPLEHNSLMGDRIEFAALARAIELASPTGQFVAGEIGAGHGLWAACFGVIAKRQGFRKIGIVALEADKSRFANLRQHLANNNLVGPADENIGERGSVSWRLYRAAAAAEDGILYWPADGRALDAGMAATKDPSRDSDYRGHHAGYQEVPAVSLGTAFNDYTTVDFLQIDIQGSEYDLVNGSIDFLCKRVRSMYIGTHSRVIESNLLLMLREHDWVLVNEKPCQFYPSLKTPTLESATYFDGGQMWVNQAFYK